jgi:hypothetical protein
MLGDSGLLSVQKISMPESVLKSWNVAGLFLAATLAGIGANAPVDRITPNIEALAHQPMIVMPLPPKWTAAKASSISIDDLIADFNKSSSKPPPINYTRRAFIRPDHEWLISFVKWFRKLGSSLDLHYEDELFDCDKYARCFVAFADLLAHKGGETRGSICVGWAVVFNTAPFAGIEAGISHSIVVIDTDKGLFVIEPQNGTMVPIDEYPNRDSLLAVYL